MSNEQYGSDGPPPEKGPSPYHESTNSISIRQPLSSAEAELLKEEYFHLQKVVEDFDSKSLTIKSWSVTLSMAGVGAAYLQEKPVILLLAALSGFLFWVVEALWKTFQYAFYNRIYDIEKYYAGELDEIDTPRISHTWLKSWHAGGTRRTLNIMIWPHVFIPHAIVFVGGIALYLLHIKFGGI